MRLVAWWLDSTQPLRGRRKRSPPERQDDMMNGNASASRRLSARRFALLATTVAGVGAAALFVAPNLALHSGAIGTPAQAQDLSARAQQLPQKPIGFADIVEKVKPAVISVRVKMERPGNSNLNNDNDNDEEIPFPPG